MQLFYGFPSENEFAVLTEEESAHCIRVLRMKAGDAIQFTDGAGHFYSGVIADAHPKKCTVQILEKKEGAAKKYSLHVAIAPTKNTDRMEWFLEKATEIGIDEITPVICDRSERRIIKTERLHKVMLAAMKQSLQAWLPVLHEAVPFEKLAASVAAEQKWICTLEAETLLKNSLKPSGNYLVLIGPEGDFTDREMLLAKQNHFVPVSLGENRLRTETAGIVACSIVSLLHQ